MCACIHLRLFITRSHSCAHTTSGSLSKHTHRHTDDARLIYDRIYILAGRRRLRRVGRLRRLRHRRIRNLYVTISSDYNNMLIN